MKIEEAIKKAYLDGINEANIMSQMKMNFDVNAMADSYTKDLVKKLTIPDIINHRELLLAFAGWLYGNLDKEVEEMIVDDYLNSK